MTGNLSRRVTRLVLPVCLSLMVQPASIHAQSAKRNDIPLGRIVLLAPNAKGTLKIQQSSKVAPINASEGMLIRRGYLLILRPRARAVVLCGDGKQRELAPGPQGCPCTQPCTPEVCGIRYGGSTLGATRGPDSANSSFPVVLAPRKTLLRNLRPTIRWSPMAGATTNTTYQVTVYGSNLNALWTAEGISETRLPYPDHAPSLMPGQTYKVVVTSAGVSSQQDPSPGLGFTTLTTNQAQRLADEEQQRKQLPLSERQIRLLVANLYAARELYTEAIEQLEDLYANWKAPDVVQTLGDLYALTGLHREAEKMYLEALTRTPTSDFEGLGLAQSSLAQVYEHLGNVEQAMARWREAVQAYRRLGNQAMVKALLYQAQRLKRPGSRR